MRFSEITVTNSSALGTSTSAGSVDRAAWPRAIMFPQVGAGGGMPSPRKLSVASTTITTPNAAGWR
ncbi:hypothetical protein BJF78_11865 [Pseudonocardia sp. CNS-139]|nr:hypothetical protein BJF78_11865 [Pseudonocardia sp. CNS-139]